MKQDEKEQGPNDENSEATSPALRVIAAFGGIRPMAQKLGLAVDTVQGWHERAAIPEACRAVIRDAAARHGIDLVEADLEASAKDGAKSSPGQPGDDVVPPGAKKASPRSSAATSAGRRRDRGSAAAATPAAKRGQLLHGMLLGAGVFAAGVLVAVLAHDLWLPLVADTTPAAVDTGPRAELIERLEGLERALAERPALANDDALEALAIEIQRLDDAVSQLEAVPEASGVDEAARMAADNLAARLNQVAGRLEEVGAAVAATESLPAEIGLLAKRLAAIEQRLEGLPRVGPDGRLALPADAAFVLAVAQLRDALRFSTPFARELGAVERLVAEDAELLAALEPLRPAGDEGVPTLEALSDAFPALARQLVVADAGGADEGWLASVKRSLSNLVTVRPVGGAVAGQGAGAIAARAEASLEAGDLAAALDELSALTGKAAEAAADWQADARRRLQAETALDLLSARVVERLAPPGLQPAKPMPAQAEPSPGQVTPATPAPAPEAASEAAPEPQGAPPAATPAPGEPAVPQGSG